MKFKIEYNNEIENKTLSYISDGYSFNMEPISLWVNFSVILNHLTLKVVNDNKIVEIWGFCPYGNWIKSNYSVPFCKKGSLKVLDEKEFGISYGINKEDWPIYVNVKTSWVCIGDPEKKGNAVEFITNCVAVVADDGELTALWLKPQSLPPEILNDN